VKEDTMGYLRGVVHGAMLGAAVALLYAPKPGRQLRQDLNSKLDRVRGQVQPVIDQAQGMVDGARPKVQETLARAQDQISRRTKLPFAGSAGTGTGGQSGPGI
jgi:gas vesicle protein